VRGSGTRDVGKFGLGRIPTRSPRGGWKRSANRSESRFRRACKRETQNPKCPHRSVIYPCSETACDPVADFNRGSPSRADAGRSIQNNPLCCGISRSVMSSRRMNCACALPRNSPRISDARGSLAQASKGGADRSFSTAALSAGPSPPAARGSAAARFQTIGNARRMGWLMGDADYPRIPRF